MEYTITAIVAISTALLGYLFGKRKTTAEAAKIELENVEKAIKIWRGIAEDLSKKVEELSKSLNEMRAENSQLKFEMQDVKNRMHELTNQHH